MNHSLKSPYLLAFAFLAGLSVVTAFPDNNFDDQSKPDRTSPKAVFAQAQKLNESGDYRKILELTSPRTKATALVGFIMQLSLLPESQTKHLAPVAKKWKQELDTYIKQQRDLEGAETSIPMILALAKWEKLDECLGDVVAVESNKPRPSWSDELQNLEVDESKANAEVLLLVNDGYFGLLTGNPLEEREAGKVEIYFYKISDSWFLSGLEEWEGSFEK